MQKLFGISNIELQEMVDDDGLDITIAYTDDLLSKNILIEFFEAEVGDDESPETENVIFAISCDDKRSYTFTLFHTFEVAGPLILYRVILDTIQFIGSCSRETVLADLEEISTGATTSEDMGNAKDIKRVYEMDKWKFDTAMELIVENRKRRKT